MKPEIEVLIASYPHREDLVAEIFVDGWQFAELRLEGGEVLVELYENNNDIWRFSFGDLIKALQDAELRLRTVYPASDDVLDEADHAS